jgi:arginyl-tRNA synthetase
MREEVQNTLLRGFQDWLKSQPAPGDLERISVSVEIPPPNVKADWASNLPMTAAKAAKRSPRQVAQEIIDKIPLGDVIEKADIAGPGFLNLILKPEWLLSELRSILNSRDHYARHKKENPGSILLEFVSANPTGPLHVGHGRGAALGDALARILTHRGYAVTTEYYVNDVGNQMENLGASVMRRCHEIDPAYLDADEAAAFQARKPEDMYQGDYIVDVAQKTMADHPKGSARPKGIEFFRKRAIDDILGGIKKDLAHFKVHHDNFFHESSLFSEGHVDRSLEVLKSKNFLKEEDGALWFLSTQFGDDKDRVIKRQSERPTYFASDIAYHDRKFQRGFDRLIDIWGTDHHGYVRRLKASTEALGYDPSRLEILLYQLVSLVREGKPVAMSTRSGQFITLTDVVNEVGADAVRFFFALRSPNSQLDFDLDLAKKQAPENPAFYVQYVHARCASLFKEAEKKGAVLKDVPAFRAPAQLDPAERSLLLKLASFPDILDQCCRDLSPHHIPTYLMALAGEFHAFYEKCRVVGDDKDQTQFRLALVDAVKTVIRNGLNLIGVSAPETM